MVPFVLYQPSTIESTSYCDSGNPVTLKFQGLVSFFWFSLVSICWEIGFRINWGLASKPYDLLSSSAN